MVAGSAMRSLRYTLVTDHSPAALVLRETSPAATPPPKLLDRVRHAIRARHYSRRTEKAYVHWVKRYIFFHAKRQVLRLELPWLDDLVRAKRPEHLPSSRATKSGG